MEGQDLKKRKAASLKRNDDDDEGKGDDDEHPDMIPCIKVEHENGENATILVPPDVSNLSPIHKMLFVDLSSDNMSVVKKKLKELADLCMLTTDNGVTNREVVRKAGGASHVVGAMRKWYNNPDIQCEGCRALVSAAMDPQRSAGNKAFGLVAKDAGALEVVVSAMKNYSDNCDVQSNGCHACANLCIYFEENVDHFVNKINGLDCILTAMRKFPDDIDVQYYACFALNTLSDWQEFRARISDLGGRQSLLDAIDTHKDETEESVKELQECAREALKNLL